MKCHYEVLNIARDADESEIKSAYKKLALKWHPDKNLNNPEEAKEQFQLVQQAYEILSDRHERAWYDNHREQILRGADKDYEDNSLVVFQYFTTSCFKGYGDDENGFFSVYQKVFETIAKEDLEYMENKEEFKEIPLFGNSKSDYYTTVGPFYNYWLSYSTKKSYVWLSPFDINETKERRVLKLMEKENKKVRQKAKKERNEEVRNLVAFVRKRDKRVQSHARFVEEKSKENKQKREELNKQRRAERRKEIHGTNEAEWSKFDNVQMELEEIEKNLAQQFGEVNSEDEESEENLINNLYCMACNKVFKTPKAFQNHESSKKHKENVDVLKETLLEEEGDYLEDDILSGDDILSDKEEISQESNEEIIQSENEEEICNVINLKSKNRKKNKKPHNILTIESDDESINIQPHEYEEETSTAASKKQRRKSKKKNNPSLPEATKINLESDDEVSIPSSRKQKKKKGKKCNEDVENIDRNHCCVSCKANFESKNKLFEHLKKTGHSVYLPKAPPPIKSKKKGLMEF